MINLAKDLSDLTSIPEKYLNKINTSKLYIINDGVYNSIKSSKCVEEFDIGIGTLVIGVEDNLIKYKFIPSNELDNSLKSTIKSNKNILELSLEKSLVNKVSELYKDLF